MINTSEKLETGIIGDIFSCNIKLEEGEVLCDKCNGRGVSEKYSNAGDYTVVCQKCQGDGKLDWVSIITGKPPKIYGSSNFHGTSGTSQYHINSSNFHGVVGNISTSQASYIQQANHANQIKYTNSRCNTSMIKPILSEEKIDSEISKNLYGFKSFVSKQIDKIKNVVKGDAYDN